MVETAEEGLRNDNYHIVAVAQDIDPWSFRKNKSFMISWKESGMLYKGNITLSEKSGMEKIITLASECNYVISTSLY